MLLLGSIVNCDYELCCCFREKKKGPAQKQTKLTDADLKFRGKAPPPNKSLCGKDPAGVKYVMVGTPEMEQRVELIANAIVQEQIKEGTLTHEMAEEQEEQDQVQVKFILSFLPPPARGSDAKFLPKETQTYYVQMSTK